LRSSFELGTLNLLFLFASSAGLLHQLSMAFTLYLANATSNAPVLSRIRPMAARSRPSSMIGRNIQYFRRMAAIARLCSARSVRKRAVPSNVSPPMDHPLAIHVRGSDIDFFTVHDKPDRDITGLSRLPTVMR
jgi:hypothetical protein